MSHEFIAGVEAPKTVTLDVEAKLLRRLKVGQVVAISIKGVVHSLNIPPDLPDAGGSASVSIRITEQRIQGLNEFSLLIEDADEED